MSNPPKTRPLMIGITGSIGCGKSTVARMLGELGGTVVDADLLARRATDAGRSTLGQIRERFGDDVFAPDGELDRAAMAAIVFENQTALADLEEIVHPEVRRMVEEILETASADEVPFVVIEAIKLVEGGLAGRCDEVWLVDCAPETQRKRLTARGVSAEDAERRLATQGPDLAHRLAERLTTGTGFGQRVRTLSTEGPIEDLRERAEDALADAFEEDPPER
ncbi:MAG: dephospho-CoA kinase [Candidatus Limnocylindrales bacterium]